MGNKQYSLTDYFNEFQNFETFVKEVNKDPSKQQQNYEGYFIYQQHYDNFYNFVEAKNNEQQQQSHQTGRYNLNPYELSTEIQQKKCPTINIDEVYNKISEGHAIKLINKKLYEAICFPNDEEKIKNKVFYNITQENLVILKETEANKQSVQYKFKNNYTNNTIDKSSILIQSETNTLTAPTVSPPNEKINKIYNDIYNYYKNEEDIITSLTSSTQKPYSGYLVDKSWVDNWKQIVKYENIKKNYLKNNRIDKNLLQASVLDELKKNSNYDGLSDVKQFIVKDFNQFGTDLQANKSFVLLNKDFLSSFVSLDSNYILFNCQLSYQNITIGIPNGNPLSFKTNNNIIELKPIIPAENQTTQVQNQNNIVKYDSELLKNLIRFPFFKKELKLPKTIPTKVLNLAYLVKKEAIEKLKKYYDLKELIEILSKNNVLNDNIDYQNSDANYPKISEYLNRGQAKYINTIKRYESQGTIRFEENEKIFSYKNIPNQQGLIYLDNFEIIDQGLALILDNKFNKSLQLIQVKYLIENNKIFLAINLNQTYMYEIVSMNPNGGNIIVEYLIGVINANIISAETNLLVCNFILNIGIYKLINSNQPVQIPSSNICLILYPINIPIPQNIIKPQPVNVPNNNANNGINSNTMIPKPMGANLKISTPPKNINISNINILNSYNPTVSNLGVQNMSAQENIPQQPLYLIHKKFMEIMKPPVHGIPTDFKQYKIKYHQTNNGFIFPMDFDIIEKETLDKINNFLNNMVPQNIFEEIYYIPINDGFIFIPKNNHIPNQNNLIYVYKGDIKTYKPHIIIQCANTQDRDNKFNLIAKDPARKNFIQNYKYFQSKYSLYCLLININNQQKITGEQPQQIINPIYKFEAQTNNVGQINNSNKVIINPINNEKMGLNNSDFNISDRLKVMLLLAVSQIYDDYPENKLSKIYLINPEWLEQYKYKKIKSLVLEKSNEIIKLWNYSYNLNSLSKIISYLNKEKKLQKYEDNMNFDNQIHNPNSDPIALQDKYIDIYKKFVIVNDQIFKLFQIYFKLPPTNEEIFYIHRQGEDFIILKNHQQNQNQVNNQNYILAGIIKIEENKFEIQYIFDYKDQTIIDNEMKILLQYNIPNYIYNKTGISPQGNKEMISPIFDNNNLIGYCYKYSKNYDYKNCFNYANYLSNNQLWTVIYLYINDFSIKTKLKNLNYNDEEFYLIKKEVVNDIKKENNYAQLKIYFEGKINSYPGQKEVYNIIRQLQQNQLIELNKNLKNQSYIPKALPNAYQIDITPIPNPTNPNEPYMILRDFELVEMQIAKIYLEKNYPCQKIKCSLLGNNMIIFHYPSNNNVNNQNYMLIVSKFDENNNNFINEYLLIYKKPKYMYSHFPQVKYQLIKYLNSLKFINKAAPIVENVVKEIGIVIELSDPPIPIPKTLNPLNLNDIIHDFTGKPLIGLENIGATCYMNATLQCLCNIRKFVSYFKYNKHLEQKVNADRNRAFLCSAFKILIKILYPLEYSRNGQEYSKTNSEFISKYGTIPKYSYPPRDFKNTISRMNPLFQGVAANDAKDLVNFLIMTLHQELNKAPPEQIVETGGNIFQEQTNKMVMFNKFIDNFKKTNQSIISDLFYALNCNFTQCSNCGTMSYNFQIYFFLIFPLEEVRKFKLMNNNNFNNNFNGFNNNFMNNANNVNNNMVDIYDCFNYDKRFNFMLGDNSMYCNYCKQTCGSQMCTTLTTGPEVLIIILNRGKGIEFNVKINFYLELNLSNYIELNNTGCQYELIGVITHIGESGMGGHFIAYCKSIWNGQWLKYNDAMADPVKDFKSEVIDFAMPYLLFYQKKNINGQ